MRRGAARRTDKRTTDSEKTARERRSPSPQWAQRLSYIRGEVTAAVDPAPIAAAPAAAASAPAPAPTPAAATAAANGRCCGISLRNTSERRYNSDLSVIAM